MSFLTPVTQRQRNSLRRIFLLLCAATFAYGVFTVLRARRLLTYGREIERQSSHFSRDYWVGKEASPSLTYLVLGDSTAAGWGAGQLSLSYPHRVAESVARLGYRVHVINRAIGGATMRDVRQNQLSVLTQLQPLLISISVGANDATHFTSTQEFELEWHQVLSALRDSKARCILVANVPDLSLAPALPLLLGRASNMQACRFNRNYERTIEAEPRFRLVDLYAQGKLDFRLSPSLYAADLFHPSAVGYARWAKLFQEKLKGL